MNEPAATLRAISCADDYDPNSMPVDKAREVIARFLSPVSTTERVHVRAALGRVLAAEVISPLDVPAHDNSAMRPGLFQVQFDAGDPHENHHRPPGDAVQRLDDRPGKDEGVAIRKILPNMHGFLFRTGPEVSS